MNHLFFLHIPKTAGTTLNAVLNDNFASSDIFDLYTDEQRIRLRETTYEELARYRLVRGHVFVTDFADILDGPIPFEVFTFLRDPVERVISEYHFLKSWPKSHVYRFLNENNVSLSEYVAGESPELRWRGRNAMVNSLSGVGHPSIEKGLEVAWHHLRNRFCFFGILERFDESLLQLSRILGLERCFYERQNVRKGRARYAATTEEVELIREHNQADIELYERACVEFDRRIRLMGEPFQANLRLFRKVNDRFQRVSRLIMARDNLDRGEILNAK
ncbi:calcium-binding protein [Pseudodesulfovibrio cashew]|uniref:Calcium-binding protein n=1 Tax=Pseudodesulfovibrio cashew TaxID=2678688 RepID=A0A6I6J9T7_9BACT|nr:sulfotransferase family 2 domain-containing protein [Pseudodesulfovibrio cashew]QGY39576.1 calcium-binding protein [Pseudodesulfovibrio cashew]